MARADNFEEFEATSLFCPRCRRATPVRKKLLLVLPSGNKYDYVCTALGADVVVLVAAREDEEQLLAHRRRAPAARTEEARRLELLEVVGSRHRRRILADPDRARRTARAARGVGAAGGP